MSNFFRHFSLGVGTWFESWGFIFRNRLTHFFIYPIIISILLGMGAVALIRKAVNFIMDLISPRLEYTSMPDGDWWDRTKDVLSDISSYAISFILWIIAWYSFRKISKYLTLAIMSPVMALLSERTETILTGKEYPFNGQQFVRDVVRGIGLAIRNFVVEIFLTVILLWGVNLFIAFFIPPLGVILSPVFAILSFLVGAYFFGFSTIDYYNERKRLTFRESILSIRDSKGIAVGNGIIFSILMNVPFVGVTIATVTCTVAATLAMDREKN